MTIETIKDISLHDFDLSNLALLRRLKEKVISAKPEVCIERAVRITSYFRDQSTNHKSAQTRYASAVASFLSKKEPFFFDDNLLAGTTTSKYFGAPVYPELTGMTIWPELDTISTREKNPIAISPEDAEILDLEIFPYWMDRNVLEITRKNNNNPHLTK